LRAQAESARGDYSDFEVILCSPEAYPAAQPKAASFDQFVSYEAIGNFLKGHDSSARGQYRAKFVATAASKSINTWVKIDDEVTNAFWRAAYDIASRDFPVLEMKELNVSKDSTWINFRPQDMPTRPLRIYVSFKGDRGFMDLTFTGCRSFRFEPLAKPLLERDMTIHQTGKSAAIRIKVDKFELSEPWETGQVRVRAAFAACERLIRFYRTHREALDRAASESLPDP
jgi:hypothetical protein